jgi:hypothetical protein
VEILGFDLSFSSLKAMEEKVKMKIKVFENN